MSSQAAEQRGSEQHVLVVYRPLATAVGLQFVVRVPLGDDGSVRVGVAQQWSPPHRFAPTEVGGRRQSGFRGGAGELGEGAGTGGGGGGGGEGRELTGAAEQAAAGQAGLGAPPMEREGDEESPGELT